MVSDNSAYTSGENYFMGGDGFNNNEAFSYWTDLPAGSVCNYSMDSYTTTRLSGLGPGFPPNAFKPNLYLNMNSSSASTTSLLVVVQILWLAITTLLLNVMMALVC